jgi:hypothetical protein
LALTAPTQATATLSATTLVAFLTAAALLLTATLPAAGLLATTLATTLVTLVLPCHPCSLLDVLADLYPKSLCF